MWFYKRIAFVCLAIFATSPLHAAGTVYAEPVMEIFGLPITNSIITSWVISLLIIFVVRLAVKVPQLNPSKGQAFVEVVVDGVRGMIEPIVGGRMVKPTFWLLSSLFIFILINNWSGLFPGVGTVGYYTGHGEEHFVPYIRPGNADLNMTLALALVSMGAWLYFILKYAGPKLILKDIFGNKASPGELPKIMYYGLGVIFFLVGIIEVISIVIRPVSLSFRLFGNVFGGESLLVSMGSLVPWILPVPFYCLELLIGFVQALVFTLLVSVYIGLICNHESEDH